MQVNNASKGKPKFSGRKQIKKGMSIIISILMVLSIFTAVPFTAGAVTSGDYEYKLLEDNTICITRYNGSESDVIVPTEIDGYNVSTIGGGSFIPSNISKVFESIIIPNGVTRIDESAFIHSTVSKIYISESITDIQPGAFRACSVAEIEVDSNNPNYTTENGVLFNKNKTVLVAYCNGNTATSYTVPNGVETIEYYAFGLSFNLEKIVISDTVTNIEEMAFWNCSSLKEIVMSDSVKHIGVNAFDTVSLAENGAFDEIDGGYYLGDCLIGDNPAFSGDFIIKDGTRLVASNALRDHSALESITVPASVEFIGDYAFLQFYYDGGEEDEFKSNLKSINVAQDNKNFCSVDGVMFNKDKTELLYYPCGKSDTTYTVPNSVKKLAKVSFTTCRLEKLYLPDTLETIDESAFQECKMTTVEIPESVKHIGKYAFIRSGIESIELPASITVIEEATFENCYKLNSVTFKGDVTNIGDYAFNRCTKLSSVDIPDTVTSIGAGAFQLTDIQEVKLPDSLVYIGEYAFNNCANLQEVIIPNNKLEIKNRAFYNCPNLLDITIPENVIEIGEAGFGYSGEKFDDNDTEAYEEKIEGVKIQGYTGTVAETYALTNEFEFISLGDKSVLLGDVNGDGKITITDATTVQKHLAKLTELTDEQLTNADTNNDGKITITDATRIQKYLAKLIPSLG